MKQAAKRVDKVDAFVRPLCHTRVFPHLTVNSSILQPGPSAYEGPERASGKVGISSKSHRNSPQRGFAPFNAPNGAADFRVKIGGLAPPIPPVFFRQAEASCAEGFLLIPLAFH